MSELRNQTTIDDYLPDKAAQERAEGWDRDGNLINPDAAPADIYGGMKETDAGALRYLAAGIRADFDAARERVLHAGMLLTDAQNRCPKGRWLEWLRQEARVPERTAQQAMQLYGVYGARELPGAYENLDASHLVELLRAPEDERDAMAERAAEEGLSVRALKAEIKALNEARAKDQLTIEGLNADHAEAQRRIYTLSQQAEAAENAIRREREAAELAKQTAEEAKKTADEMRKVSSSAAMNAERSARQASDAVQRANETQEKLRAAEARIAELESAPPVTVEVARTDDDAHADKRRLALALRVRFAAQDIKSHLREAVEAAQTAMRATMEMWEQLKALDPARAEALHGECINVARWAQDCRDAEPTEGK